MNENERLGWFWQQDCGEASTVITSTAETKLKNNGIKPIADGGY